MITAQEALFKSIQGAKNSEIPKEIEDGILDSCSKGCWYYLYEGVASYEVTNLLHALGYKVDRLTILGKPTIQISWNND